MTANIAGSQTDEKYSDMVLKPVGTIKNSVKEPFLKTEENGLQMRGKLDDVSEMVQKTKYGLSEIIIHDDLEGVLDGIDDYSHLVVLYWAHKVPEHGRSLDKIHPMGRKEIPEKGIFSTCSPARPNPILMTIVKLSERKGNILTVSGLDAIDGSPVLDIKPYVSSFYPQNAVFIADWMRNLLEEVAEEEN